MERRHGEEDQLRLQTQLRHADRLATIGQLAAEIARQLNEPPGKNSGCPLDAEERQPPPSVPIAERRALLALAASAGTICHTSETDWLASTVP